MAQGGGPAGMQRRPGTCAPCPALRLPSFAPLTRIPAPPILSRLAAAAAAAVAEMPPEWRKYSPHAQLFPWQEEAFGHVAQGVDLLNLQGTGKGKSLLHQLPTLARWHAGVLRKERQTGDASRELCSQNIMLCSGIRVSSIGKCGAMHSDDVRCGFDYQLKIGPRGGIVKI